MEAVIVRLVVVAGVIAAAALVGRLVSRGRVRTPEDAHLTADELQAVGLPDAPARALLLGSPTCAPCGTVRQLLDELAGERDGLVWAYADAADHLELVRRHGITRVPTLLVVDRDGRVVARASGVPARDELAEAIARAA